MVSLSERLGRRKTVPSLWTLSSLDVRAGPAASASCQPEVKQHSEGASPEEAGPDPECTGPETRLFVM